MVLANKFNDNFKAQSLNDMMLGMYAASNYGSNAYCFAQAARIATPVNDTGAAVETTLRRIPAP